MPIEIIVAGIIGVWILCSVYTYGVACAYFWNRFGEVLGFKRLWIAAFLFISFFGPAGLLAIVWDTGLLKPKDLKFFFKSRPPRLEKYRRV